MRVLIVHHLEEMWERGYQNQGTSFEELADKLLVHLDEVDYDRVILTRFESHELGDEHYLAGLNCVIDEVQVYGYGWEASMIPDFPVDQKWCDGGSHSEVVLIDRWIEELKGHEVYLCGAFDGECVEDMEIALEGARVKYKRVEELIV